MFHAPDCPYCDINVDIGSLCSRVYIINCTRLLSVLLSLILSLSQQLPLNPLSMKLSLPSSSQKLSCLLYVPPPPPPPPPPLSFLVRWILIYFNWSLRLSFFLQTKIEKVVLDRILTGHIAMDLIWVVTPQIARIKRYFLKNSKFLL